MKMEWSCSWDFSLSLIFRCLPSGNFVFWHFYFWKFSFRYLVSNSSIRCTRYFLEYFSVCRESQISIAQIIELMIWVVLAVFWIASRNSDKDCSQQSRSCLASVLLDSLVFFPIIMFGRIFLSNFISSFSVVYDEFLASS
jgi:hypothetical protein